MVRLAEHLVALPYRQFCTRVVQGYRVGEVAGIGGSGVAFAATDPDGRPVVLKLLRPLRSTYDLAAVWQEVAPLCRIDHPAVPAWRGVLREGRAYFIVLDRMPGMSLSTWLFERRHTFDAVDVARMGAQLVDALAALHAAGIAHGDLRPANILHDGERVSLVDFGMARLAENSAGAFAAACAIDVAGFADIVLYLLYSSHESGSDTEVKEVSRHSKDPSWREELSLNSLQRSFLEQALAGAENPKTCLGIEEARMRFAQAFDAQ